MEILLIITGIIFLWWLVSFLIDKWKEKEKDRAVEDIFSNKKKEKIITESANFVSMYDYAVKNIRDKISMGYLGDKKFTDAGADCPECGAGKLVIRNGIYGGFLGCSQYPRCSYTKSSKYKSKETFWADLKTAYFK